MNKIKVEQEVLKFKDESVLVEQVLKNCIVYIQGNVCLAILEVKCSSIEIHLEKRSHLLIEFLLKLKAQHIDFKIYNEEDTVLDFHLSCTYSDKNEIQIYSQINQENVRNYIQVRTVEENGSLILKATGNVLENAFHAYYLEDIKSLTQNNLRVKVIPELFVKNNDVVANHNATISQIPATVLFYFLSFGMSQEAAIRLIKSGFLRGILQIEEIKNKEVSSDE